MKAELFAELLKSVREGGAILRGEKAPSRAFVVVMRPEIRHSRQPRKKRAQTRRL
jgi:hypothetical protein